MNEENQTIIKALNMYGRVPEQWELLKEIEKLQQENKQLKENYQLELEENEKLSELWCKNNKILIDLGEFMKENEGMYIFYAISRLQELKEKYK